MKLKPVNDKIVVKPKIKSDDNITESGILLPDTASSGKLLEGEVVSVGKGMYSANGKLIPVVVEVGDIILYDHNAHVYEYDDCVIMSVNEVLSILGD